MTIIKEMACKQSQIEVALSEKNNAEKRITELTAEGIAEKESCTVQIQAFTDKTKELSFAKVKISNDYIILPDDAITKIEHALSNAKQNIMFNIENIAMLKEQLVSLDDKLKAIAKALRDIEQIKTERTYILQEESEWTFLQNACPALRIYEIDGVVPLITGDANKLLSQTFGSRFAVDIKTQDDEGNEIFKIIVLRNDGSDCMLKNLSGGEKIPVLKALSLALTLISKEKSDKNILTAFADEEDGALDIENAINFVKLYRSFMSQGGFESVYFISHRPEAIAMADHRISLNENGVIIQ